MIKVVIIGIFIGIGILANIGALHGMFTKYELDDAEKLLIIINTVGFYMLTVFNLLT